MVFLCLEARDDGWWVALAESRNNPASVEMPAASSTDRSVSYERSERSSILTVKGFGGTGHGRTYLWTAQGRPLASVCPEIDLSNEKSV